MLTSLKFKRLCKVLGLPKPHVVGLLELLWQAGYAAASDVIGDEVDVETACEWEGELGALAKVLLAERWLDTDESGTICIHDFWEHAPQYVQRKRDRAQHVAQQQRNKIDEERSKRAAISRAYASRNRRKSEETPEVKEETAEQIQELVTDEPVASQQLAYLPTYLPKNNNYGDGPKNEVEEQFLAEGITLDGSAEATPEQPPQQPDTRGGEVVADMLRGSTAVYHLGTKQRRELAEMCDAEGDEPSFRRAMQAALDAKTRRSGPAFVSYVSKTLATIAAEHDAEKRKPPRTPPKRANIDGAAKPARSGLEDLVARKAAKAGAK